MIGDGSSMSTRQKSLLLTRGLYAVSHQPTLEDPSCHARRYTGNRHYKPNPGQLCHQEHKDKVRVQPRAVSVPPTTLRGGGYFGA